MERVMKLFHKEFSRISDAAIVLAFFTLLSQVLAIFRDRFLAGNLGTGQILDVYYAAFRVPDLLFTLGASLVSVSILMPFFMEHNKRSPQEGKTFINSIFSSFFLGITLVSIVCFFCMPFLSKMFFPGFSEEALKETILLSRIMLLSPILLGISNLFATVTQAFKQFFVYAIAPIFYNIGIILGVTIFYRWFGVAGLAYGVIFGAFLHMAIQIPVIYKHGLLPKFSLIWNRTVLIKILAYSVPRTITLSLSKIVFLIFVSLASLFAAGTISVFNLSYNLQSVPLAIIGVSYSIAAFPVLVDHFKSGNISYFLQAVMVPIRQIVFWSLPVISLFVVLRAQIVRVILGSGNFDWSDTRLTAASLALFIISVTAQSIILLLVRAYYAAEKTWRPFWITLASSAVTIIFAFIFTKLFTTFPPIQFFFERLLRIEGVAGSSVIMLSFAYSIGNFINVWWLWHVFYREFREDYQDYGIKKSFTQSFVASSLLGLVAYLVLNFSDTWFPNDVVWGVFLHGLLAGVVGIMCAFFFLLFVNNEEIKNFLTSIKRKLKIKNPVEPIQEHL
jgi:putative peptidoglycan lipid II flippase